MKKFILLFVFLVGCGISGPDLSEFTAFEPEEIDQWIESLEIYYGQELPSIYQTNWHHGSRDNVQIECGAENSIGGCAWFDGTILVATQWKNSCLLGTHEIMHLAMMDVYGDSDPNHTRSDWTEVMAICRTHQLEE